METKIKKDSEFYQDALQKRFDQMETFQEKCEDLEAQITNLKEEIAEKDGKLNVETNNNIVAQEKITKLMSENAELKIQLDQLNQSKVSPQIVELAKKQLNQKIEENFSLKQTIDLKRTENEKLKKKLEATQDMFTNRKMELEDAKRDLKEAQQQINMKTKNENQLNTQIFQQKQ